LGLINWMGKSLRPILCKVSWGAALYHLRVLRNNIFMVVSLEQRKV